MATFTPAYQIVIQNEGGYSNNPADLGGETYAGIARNIWPNWSGWVIVDFEKRTRGLNTNDKIAGINGKVEEFYRDRWAASRAGEINSQEVANIFFDFFILHSQAVRAMQQVLNESFGYNLAADNIIGSQTLAAINAVDPAKLHDSYKAKRMAIHTERVQARPDQALFLKGWLQRTAGFPTLTGPGSLMIIALLAAAFLTLYYLEKKQSNNNSK